MAKKLNKKQQAEFDALCAAMHQARAEAKANPCKETREAAIAIGAELSAWVMENNPPKISGYGSRAGQRQHATQRAITEENKQRAAQKARGW
jgi:hypothetical protein